MITFEEFVAVMIGGAIGSFLRFFIQRAVQFLPLEGGFPYGVLIVNITGSFVIGFLSAVLVGKYHLSPVWRTGIFIGVLGGFTTFSSFSLDTITLFESSRVLYGYLNIALSVCLCLAATALGLFLGRLLVQG